MLKVMLRSCLLVTAVCRLWAGPCIMQTLDQYELLTPNVGCTVGANSFENFSFVVQFQSGLPQIALPTDVLVTPVMTPTDNGLSFSSTKFAESGSQSVTYLLIFAEDPTGSIRSLDDALFDPATSPGLGQITSSGCLGGMFTAFNTCSTGNANIVGPITVFDNGVNSVHYAATAFTPVLVMGIQHQILITGGGSGSVTSPPNEPFTLGSQFLPEPGAGWMAAAGIAALFFVRRRALRKHAAVRLQQRS